jgi:hypothetical protein
MCEWYVDKAKLEQKWANGMYKGVLYEQPSLLTSNLQPLTSRLGEPVSRVLSSRASAAWVIIYLGRTLLCGSCGDTREVGGQLRPSPIRPCSRWGLPSLRLTTELVVSYTTVSALLRRVPGSGCQVSGDPHNARLVLRHLTPITRHPFEGFSFLWHFPYPVRDSCR